MGILGFVAETVFISTGFAAARRCLGFNARDMVEKRIERPNVRRVAAGFFNIGEYTFDKVVDMAVAMKAREARNNDHSGGHSSSGIRDSPKREDDYTSKRKLKEPMMLDMNSYFKGKKF